VKETSVLTQVFFRVGSALRLRGPLANDPTAQILNTLLVGVLCWGLFDICVIIPLHATNKLASTAQASCVALIFAIALVLLYRGSLRAASLVYLSGIWVLATIAIALTNGIHSPWVVFYVALPISSAWLLGYRPALVAAGICLITALSMAVLELNGVPMPRYLPGKPLGIFASIVVAMIIAAVPVARILQIYKQALAGLREHHEHLEELVENRTAELVIARDEAQAANQAKSVFLANMSHELRTPLNAILGFSNLMMRDDANLSEAHRKDLEIVNRSGEHLLSLIDDVLDMSKIDAGRTEVAHTDVDLRELMRGVSDMIRMRAEEKGLQLVCRQSRGCPNRVRTDGAKLRQVLVNLVGNAVKYTNQGSVTLRLDTDETDCPRHLLLRFEVEDTGIGIAHEDQELVFEPFVQLAKETTQTGTGLGLAITKKFVELMGGTIWVESKPGQGSLFRVHVPVERAVEPKDLVPEGAERSVIGLAPGQPAYRILVVEDRRENWLLLQRLLEEVGFLVRVAENGSEAVEMFRTWRPCLIWMDVRLPIMNGLEAARRIRALEGGRDVKIVALTASAFTEQRQEVLDGGLDDFVRKPYQPREIFECMARQISVQFLYRDDLASAAEPAFDLRPEAFATLSPELRGQLDEALIALDVRRIGELVARVSEQDPALGSALAHCADRFAFTPILSAIRDGNYRTASA
jgi:signal transduction histidine kinase/DNA-binding NarL/FixJ family response regulator